MTFQPTKPRVLIVDDSRTVRAVLSMHLRDAGMDPTAVGTVAEGLDAAFRLQPAVVVLDVMILGFDGATGGGGLSLLRKLKRDPRTEAIPVVMMSGEPGGRTARLAIAAGASAYVTKSDVGLLVAEVARLAT